MTGQAQPRALIAGGGLAGLAAAVRLASAGVAVELHESNRFLGGRAGSFWDPQTGEELDQCQHVSMGCCTQLALFCEQTGIARHFRRDRQLLFIGPDGERCQFMASRFLPAPLHLVPSFLRLNYLTWAERFTLARAVAGLIRMRGPALDRSVSEWLQETRQNDRIKQRFWEVLLVSALAETLDRVTLQAAQKVIVEGFVQSRAGYELRVPLLPLRHLFDRLAADWLQSRQVRIYRQSPVTQIFALDGRLRVTLANGEERTPLVVICALPWFRLQAVLDGSLLQADASLRRSMQLQSSPITGVHLWLDRPLGNWPHAVLVGRMSQWVFRGLNTQAAEGPLANSHAYQVVISASRTIAGMPKEDLLATVCHELRQCFPEAGDVTMLHGRVVSVQQAVFSPLPGCDALRPQARTKLPNFFLAGDYTQTGWPSTMEGAVRSGFLAADAALSRATP